VARLTDICIYSCKTVVKHAQYKRKLTCLWNSRFSKITILEICLSSFELLHAFRRTNWANFILPFRSLLSNSALKIKGNSSETSKWTVNECHSYFTLLENWKKFIHLIGSGSRNLPVCSIKRHTKLLRAASSPGMEKNFHFSISHRPALRFTQPSIQRVSWSLSPGVKRQGREADHSPPTSAEGKKAWIYTATPHKPSLRST
jgi:hypothetical protein